MKLKVLNALKRPVPVRTGWCQRPAFEEHLRHAIGPAQRFTEHVHVAALIGHTA
jgi:hypothetical protein